MVVLVNLASISLQFDNCDRFRKEFGGLLRKLRSVLYQL